MQFEKWNRRKWPVSLALIAATGMVLAGCTATPAPVKTVDNSPQTITVQVQAGQEKEIQAVIDIFTKKYPNVTVNTESVTQQAKSGTNLQVLTSNAAPDVGVVPTNSQVFPTLTDAKQLVSLADVWKAEKLDKRYGSLAPTFKTDGTPYVVVYHQTITPMVYYNKDLFAKLGIPEPADHRIASMDELNSIVAKLKANGLEGLAIGPADNYQLGWLINCYLPTFSTPDQFANYLSSWQKGAKITAKYTDAPFVNAVKVVQDLGKAGVFQSGYLGQKVPQAEALFVQQKSGMLLDGSYSVAVLQNKDNITFDLGWAVLPPAKGAVQKMEFFQGAVAGYGIPVKAKNPTWAKKFLEVLVSVEGQTSVIASSGNLPVVNDVPAEAYSSLPQVLQDIRAFVADNPGYPGWTSVLPGGVGQQFIDPLLQEMLNGNGTPESIAEAQQAKVEESNAGN